MKTRKTTLIFSIFLIYLLSTNISYTQTFNYNLPSGAIKRFEQGVAVYAVAFSPDGSLLASGGNNNRVVLWNIGNQMEPKVFRGHTKSVMSVVFSPDGQLLASASHDGYVRLWNVSSKRTLQPLFHDGWVRSVAFSPDGKILVSGGGDQIGSITLWDPSNNNRIVDFPGHRDIVESIEFSPNGQMLVSTSRDRTVKLWDVASQRVLRSLTEHRNVVYAVAFSPNNDMFATSSNDYTIKFWKTSSGAILEDFRISGSGNTRALSLAFSPDGKYLAYACTDYTVRLWNVTERKETKLRGHDGVVTSVAFSPDGKTLASGSHDRTIILWKLSHFNIHPSNSIDEPNPIHVQIPEPEPVNVLVDTSPPDITILSPSTGVVPVDTYELPIRGEVTTKSSIGEIRVNGKEVWLSAEGIFTTTVPISGGENEIKVTATDINNNMGTKRITVERLGPIDYDPPIITFDETYQDQQPKNSELTISGKITDNNPIGVVKVNDKIVTVGSEGKFAANVLLRRGRNTIRVTATDTHGNLCTDLFTISVPNPPPIIRILTPNNLGSTVNVVRGLQPIITIKDASTNVSAEVEDDDGISKVTVNGNRVEVRGNYISKTVHLNYGENTILVTATDTLNKQAEKEITIYRPEPIRKDYALLFAVEDYEHWPKLRHPISDAEKIQRALESIYGFKSEIIKNPTKEDIYRSIRKYAEKSYNDEDQLFIFFAGHGHFHETFREGNLVAKDTKLPNDDTEMLTYVSHSRIRDIIDRMNCKHIFLVMDTCYSGTFDREIAMRGSTEDVSKQQLRDDDIKRILKNTTRWYLTSGQNERVPDVSKFVRQLLYALQSMGGEDRVLTIEEVLSYMKQLRQPTPKSSEFGSNESGSDFLFFAK
ncbi:hypothetical protein F4X73_01760 [Candidatus Poribacteria bacterium]|nr:hypothetical protein [Candidatus Poribacteria bacterium]MYB63391.1 hypothetical protein [Candidatus Poribacteria bacterium]MYF55554.1 hypothetical protein [Candidatus Poribacteria bacterium]